MSSADRVGVPLNSRCSRKWVDPKWPGCSSLDPTATQYPMVRLRAPGTCSLSMRTPLGRTVRRTRASPAARNESSAWSRGKSTAPFISPPTLLDRSGCTGEPVATTAETLALTVFRSIPAPFDTPSLAKLYRVVRSDRLVCLGCVTVWKPTGPNPGFAPIRPHRAPTEEPE